MWVYLNNSGIPTTRIPHGEVIRQQSSFNIYIAFDKDDFKVNGESFDSEVALLSYLRGGNFITTIHFKKPSETEFNEFRYIDEDHISIKTFKKTHDSEITYDLVDGKRYVVYSFHGHSDFTDEYGTYEASITFYKISEDSLDEETQVVHTILKSGNIQFYVEKTYGDEGPNKKLNITQYDYLLSVVKSIPRLDRQLSDIGVFPTYVDFARESCRQASQDGTPRILLGYVEEAYSNVVGIVQYFDENKQNVTIYSSNYEDLVHFYDQNGNREFYSLKSIDSLEADVVKVWFTPSDDYDAVNKKHLDDNFYNKTEIDNSNVALSQEITEAFEENKKYTDEKVSVKADRSELFSKDYNDLTNKPEVYTKTEINDKLTRDNVISIIGKASQALDGIMSKEDKKNLDAVVALLEEDDNNIVDKINEVLAIFNQYPEGAELVTVLSQKQDKLVSGMTIKTINNISLLGEGDIAIEAGETLIENESLTTVAVGGVSKGVSLNGKSVVEVLENIFFPYVAFAMGSISSSPGNGTVVEKGTSKTLNSITQAITLGSKSLTSLKLYKGSELLQEKTSGITTSNTFSSLAQSLTATTTFKVEATDGTTNLSKSINVFTFVDPYFYGILDTNTTPTSGDITNKTKAVASKGNKTYSFTCTAKFPFIAYPASYGNLKSILDGNGFENLTDFTKHTVTLSITSGNVSYNVYIKNSAATVTNFAYTFKY